jgi:TATA-binding protein-associated factor
MGLGKTLQTLCMVASDHHLRADEFARSGDLNFRRLPSIIVCPPTLSGHWQQEIRQFAPFLTSVAYVGSPPIRGQYRDQLDKVDIVITSYDICRNDMDILKPINWNYCVLDEGHLIKNSKSKTSQAVKNFQSNHRLILSGTPIQNNVLELWSLFDFLMPGFLGSEKVFQERFAKPIAASRFAKSSSKEQERGALAVEALHKQVLPFLLRRLKEEVLDDLPLHETAEQRDPGQCWWRGPGKQATHLPSPTIHEEALQFASLCHEAQQQGIRANAAVS